MIEKLREEFQGVAAGAGRTTGYDDGAVDLERRDRPAPGADRALPRRRPTSRRRSAYAQRSGLEVAVRGGGPQLRRSRGPRRRADDRPQPLERRDGRPRARRARCGGGATWAELDAATQEHGLAVTGGTISHTGVGGLTLGGGMGWLTRTVRAERRQPGVGRGRDRRRARCCGPPRDEHPDLFWALRGGGGNFGVVTEFEFRLHPVGPMVQLGLFFWGLEPGAEALRVARDIVDGAAARRRRA